jgi:glycosyltransferase involved in cell wall biosynthesis
MISVVIATYNGEKFIKIQLESIIQQLSLLDEIIIVDDASIDLTVDIINNFKDDRIKLFINSTNLGHVKSFEKGLLIAGGDIIFLSDQDDFWLPNKVTFMSNYLIENNLDLVISSYILTNIQGKINYNQRNLIEIPRSNKFYNMISFFSGKNNYFGSIMCFKKSAIREIIPFPNYLDAHDLYIAFHLNFKNRIGHINLPFVLRTITGHNLTNSDRSLFKKVLTRFKLIKSLFYVVK